MQNYELQKISRAHIFPQILGLVPHQMLLHLGFRIKHFSKKKKKKKKVLESSFRNNMCVFFFLFNGF